MAAKEPSHTAFHELPFFNSQVHDLMRAKSAMVIIKPDTRCAEWSRCWLPHGNPARWSPTTPDTQSASSPNRTSPGASPTAHRQARQWTR